MIEKCKGVQDNTNTTQTTRATACDDPPGTLARDRNRYDGIRDGNDNAQSSLSLLSYCSPLPLRLPFPALNSRKREPPPVIIELEQIR